MGRDGKERRCTGDGGHLRNMVAADDGQVPHVSLTHESIQRYRLHTNGHIRSPTAYKGIYKSSDCLHRYTYEPRLHAMPAC